MWILPLARREMVDLLAAGPPPRAVESDAKELRPARGDQMIAVWPARPEQFGRMPTLIVVPDGAIRDVMAWFVTYTRDYRPFTAFCRVVEFEVAERFLNGPPAPGLWGMEGICAGLVFGEALVHAHGSSVVLELPSTVYSATLSYAICRLFALTGGVHSLGAITHSWLQTRMATGHHDLPIDPDDILRICGMTMGFSGATLLKNTPHDPCAAAWSDLMTIGEIGESTWQRLVVGLPELTPLRTLVKLPREQRLHSVEMSFHLLMNGRREGADRRSFLAGYFTSLLAPGTLDHADLLAPIAPMLPTALIWYGLFGSTSFRGEHLPSSNGVARRIIRDLTLPDRIIDRPRCDIACDEFALAGLPSPPSVTGKVGRLDVDLLPGVTMSVRWPPRQGADEDAARRARDNELNQLVSELQMVSGHQRAVTERLREILGSDSAKRPPQSPPPSRKRKGSS